MISPLSPPRRSADEDERILPLINIVFLLLIFFMVVGRISAADPFDVEPPGSDSSTPAGQRDLTVHLGEDGRIAVDGAVVADTGFETALKARLDAGRPASVWVKSDRRAEARRLIRVMRVLRGNGVETVRLITARRNSP